MLVTDCVPCASCIYYYTRCYIIVFKNHPSHPNHPNHQAYVILFVWMSYLLWWRSYNIDDKVFIIDGACNNILTKIYKTWTNSRACRTRSKRNITSVMETGNDNNWLIMKNRIFKRLISRSRKRKTRSTVECWHYNYDIIYYITI